MKTTYRFTIFLSLMILLYFLYRYQNRIIEKKNILQKNEQTLEDHQLLEESEELIDMIDDQYIDSNKDSIDQITIDNVSQLSFNSYEDIADQYQLDPNASYGAIESIF